jgi:SAM-dependent methyltransferase
VEHGVLRLVERNNSFYEGVYAAQVHLSKRSLGTLRGRMILFFVTYGYLKAVYDMVKPGGDLLELGCGSGCVLFGERFQVTAVDVSFKSLVGAPSGYALRLQADATKLDFPKESFDGIVASCFWEHLTFEQKEILLEKAQKWLKPGGKIILLYDTASQNPWFRWFRTYPELYQQCFINHDGHLGLETVRDNLTRFERAGFKSLRGIGLNRTIQHLPVYGWLQPYGAVSPWAKRVFSASRTIEKSAMLLHSFTAVVHLWDLTLGRLFPLGWSRLYLGIWQKSREG